MLTDRDANSVKVHPMPTGTLKVRQYDKPIGVVRTSADGVTAVDQHESLLSYFSWDWRTPFQQALYDVIRYEAETPVREPSPWTQGVCGFVVPINDYLPDTPGEDEWRLYYAVNDGQARIRAVTKNSELIGRKKWPLGEFTLRKQALNDYEQKAT